MFISQDTVPGKNRKRLAQGIITVGVITFILYIGSLKRLHKDSIVGTIDTEDSCRNYHEIQGNYNDMTITDNIQIIIIINIDNTI